jgi:hypothetical protein
VPVDLGDCSADWVGVLEDHHCLGRDALREKLRLLAREILFEQINLVVLSNGLLGASSKITGSLGEAEGGISVELLLILGNIAWLSVVELLRPTYKRSNFKLFRN